MLDFVGNNQPLDVSLLPTAAISGNADRQSSAFRTENRFSDVNLGHGKTNEDDRRRAIGLRMTAEPALLGLFPAAGVRSIPMTQRPSPARCRGLHVMLTVFLYTNVATEIYQARNNTAWVNECGGHLSERQATIREIGSIYLVIVLLFVSLCVGSCMCLSLSLSLSIPPTQP